MSTNEKIIVPPELSAAHIAQRFVDEYGKNWRFHPKWNAWFFAGRNYWMHDDEKAILRLIYSVCLQIASTCDDKVSARQICCKRTIIEAEFFARMDSRVITYSSEISRDETEAKAKAKAERLKDMVHRG